MVESSTVAITVEKVALTAVPAWLNLFLAAGLAVVYMAAFLRQAEVADLLAALSYMLVAAASAWALLDPGAHVGQVYVITIVHLLANAAIRSLPELRDKFGVNTPQLSPLRPAPRGTGRPLASRSEVV